MCRKPPPLTPVNVQTKAFFRDQFAQLGFLFFWNRSVEIFQNMHRENDAGGTVSMMNIN